MGLSTLIENINHIAFQIVLCAESAEKPVYYLASWPSKFGDIKASTILEQAISFVGPM
jgi:hypothetical protein